MYNFCTIENCTFVVLQQKEDTPQIEKCPLDWLYKAVCGLLEVSVQQTLESLAVSCLVLSHLMKLAAAG